MKRKPAWFRIFFVLGKIIPCWWDPVKHIYDVVTKEDIVRFRLNPLYELVKQIARIYKLGFFSTEIAIENGRRFVVVDYINDQCDMRKKSRFADGVCDEIVDVIVEEVVNRLDRIT
jgi:hypothetical protein